MSADIKMLGRKMDHLWAGSLAQPQQPNHPAGQLCQRALNSHYKIVQSWSASTVLDNEVARNMVILHLKSE